MLDSYELNEETNREIETIADSMAAAKTNIEALYKKTLGEFHYEFFEALYDHIENDIRYDFKRWIRTRCDEIIHALLAGETSWLKDTSILSEYTFGRLQEIRLAIYAAAKDDLLESATVKLKKENRELRNELEQMRERFYEYRQSNPSSEYAPP